MVLPLWLTALGGVAGGMQQQVQRQQDQKNREQMIQALMGQRNQQNPGGFGATPASYGAQNVSHGGTIYDQWGNPIGPAGAPSQAMGPAAGQGPAANPAATSPTVQPDIWSQGAATTPFAGASDPSLTAVSMPPGMSPAAPIPGLGGPSQATPPPGVGGFQDPGSALDQSVISALFAPQGA